MVEFRTKIYYEEQDNIVGAEVVVYSTTGENIGSIQVTSKQQFDELVSKLNGLDERFILKTGLQEALEDVSVDANTLNNLSSADFALVNHDHANDYAPKDHATISTIHGLGENYKYGHVKVIDNLTSSQYKDGESLSAYQGKVLKTAVDGKAPISHNHGWTTIFTDKVIKGVGTCSLYINKQIQLGFFYLNITTSKSIASKNSILLYDNSTYGTAGGRVSHSLIPLGMQLTVNYNGEFKIYNQNSNSASTGENSYQLLYKCKPI